MKRDDALFFSSTFLFLLAGLLYAWGSPSWFSRFPYSTGLRFLLALETYFLCCAFFFALRVASFPGGATLRFAIAFCVSFAAIPVFSALVLSNSPIQDLTAFEKVLDIAVWLFATVLQLRAPSKERLLFFTLFLLSGTVFLFTAIPSIAPVGVRFFVFAAFFAKRLRDGRLQEAAVPAGDASALHDTAERFALSPRETEVLALLLAGRTNAEIGDTLFISLSTVKTHIASIFVKTGARNRLEVSALCKKT